MFFTFIKQEKVGQPPMLMRRRRQCIAFPLNLGMLSGIQRTGEALTGRETFSPFKQVTMAFVCLLVCRFRDMIF